MSNSQEFRELIIKNLEIKNISLSKMAKELGFGNSFFADMKRHDTMPSAEKLVAIAQYLEVSTDYLLGLTDKPEVNR
ncbi:MAG: helix-turn-helix domain-containing protein [Oscillospiraceae bacterium]|nr:helix-turn-helix domain-containing protein [Oscillospiraceae bacterium]